jgi:transmembrane sensor
MTDLAMLPELARVEEEDPRGRAGADSRGRPGGWSGLAVTLGAVMTVVAGVLLAEPGPQAPMPSGPSAPEAFATRVAEIRDVFLEDGSRVTLGAASRIEPDFSGRLRIVTLLEGEAFFDVVPDPERPFYVEAGDRLIRVVGTRFDVRQGRETVRIAVVEGVVELLKVDSPRQAETVHPGMARDVLRAGDEVVAKIGSAETTLGAIQPEEAAPWRRGWLSYENASLGEIVADANRYSRRQIVLVDGTLSDLRMTAAFSAEKIDQFAMGLEVSYGLQVDYTDPDRIALSRAEGG